MNRSVQADFSAVIVAAGAASRFAGALPKQFCDLGGRTVLERSIAAICAAEGVGELVVVLAADRLQDELGRGLALAADVRRVVGGATRAESVLAGVAACTRDYCLVHDAARPAVTRRLVESVIDATRRHGAAAPLLPVVDTVKQVEGDWISSTVDRASLRLAQTPQGARRDWLIEALEGAISRGGSATDEAAALEASGRKVFALPGEGANQKITTLEDLERVRRLGFASPPELRVGSGFDIHRTDPARPLVLGGIHFDEGPGLAGHSDADVVLHAAMDALLGAAGLGDIGEHFPPDDPRFAGADSAQLAREVAGMIAEQGYSLVNLDLTLLSERPKIRPRVVEMKARIAECLGTVPERVGLKATTLERLGSLGRGEGMACEAVALLARTGAM